MLSRAKTAAVLVALATALPGSAFASDTIEEQRSALLDCKRQRGVAGVAYFYQRRPDPSSEMMAVQIVPYDQVSVTAANAINSCAGNRVGLLPQPPRQPKTIIRSIRQPAGYGGAHCGNSPSVLYKGDLYCPRRP